MYILKLKHDFSASHQLTHAYSSECNDYRHGHNWKVLVEIRAHELINGMLIDFKKLKEVINKLDHRDLNIILDFEPTAENISKYLYDEIEKEVKQEFFIIKITVWEADKASITYEL